MDTGKKIPAEVERTVADALIPFFQDGDQVGRILPDDLETTAATIGALIRRRGLRRAIDLLRIILAYAMCYWPLRLVYAEGDCRCLRCGYPQPAAEALNTAPFRRGLQRA